MPSDKGASAANLTGLKSGAVIVSTYLVQGAVGLLISLLLLAISCSIWIATSRVNKEIQAGEQVRMELQSQIEDEKQQQDIIQDKIDYLKSDEYIEEIARDKLGLIFENEIIFKKQKK